jgi:hypothetical protein
MFLFCSHVKGAPSLVVPQFEFSAIMPVALTEVLDDGEYGADEGAAYCEA